MPFLRASVKDRKATYAELGRLTIEREFGGGSDGCVFQANHMTAIKVFGYTELYHRELESHAADSPDRITRYLQDYAATDDNSF